MTKLNTPAVIPADETAAILASLQPSQTVAVLADKDKPQPENVCIYCPAGLWFTTPAEVKCFCRAMRNLSWQTNRPTPVTRCDGLFSALAAAEAEAKAN